MGSGHEYSRHSQWLWCHRFATIDRRAGHNVFRHIAEASKFDRNEAAPRRRLWPVAAAPERARDQPAAIGHATRCARRQPHARLCVKSRGPSSKAERGSTASAEPCSVSGRFPAPTKRFHGPAVWFGSGFTGGRGSYCGWHYRAAITAAAAVRHSAHAAWCAAREPHAPTTRARPIASSLSSLFLLSRQYPTRDMGIPTPPSFIGGEKETFAAKQKTSVSNLAPDT